MKMRRFDECYSKIMHGILAESAVEEDPEFKAKVMKIAEKLSEELEYDIDPEDFYEQLGCDYEPEGGDHLAKLESLNDAELEKALREDMENMKAIDADMKENPGDYLEEGKSKDK